MHFGENQLSPGSIGISPLPTGHPPVLQHWWVRASTRCYPRFTLPMGSSPGFGSHPGNTTSPFQTRFRSGSRLSRRLTSPPSKRDAANIHSPAHSTKGTPSGRSGIETSDRCPPTACERTVSGSLSSPSRGAFHLSLTVLVHYRSPGVLSLGGWSPQLPTGFLVSGGTQVHVIPQPHGRLSATGLSPAPVRPSQTASRRPHLVAVSSLRCPDAALTTPPAPPRERCHGLGSARFARHYSGNLLISLPRGTEMFQFPRCPPPAYDSAAGLVPSRPRGCPIRIRWAHRSHAAPPPRFAALRVLLRPWRLGIHPAPSPAWRDPHSYE